MDYQSFVDNLIPISCVLSVEKQEDGKYGSIRIVAGNRAYINSIEGDNKISAKMLSRHFVPNSDYQDYLQKDLTFEDYCYRCAILKQPLHSYVHLERFDLWFHILMLPLASDRENVGYCSYSMEVSKETNTRVMTDLSQETAADVLNTCIKLRGTDDFEKTVNEVMADIRKICDARHVCLLQVDFANRTCSMLAQAFADKAKRVSMNHWQDEEHYKLVMTWAKMVAGNGCLIVKNEDDMQVIKDNNEEWYESLHRAQVNSIVMFPLRVGGDLLGYIWATNFDIANTIRIKETLELTTFFLASEIANYQLLNRLHTLSTVDMLTGVKNRNAMNNRVEALKDGKEEEGHSIGVVFADLNGLKRVNDYQGHQAGDLLLKNAAMALQNVFVGVDIYRAGGDEFLVLLTDTSLQELEAKAKHLKEISPSYGNAVFAVGCGFQEDSRNVRDAMMEADEAMYADKKEFYISHPNLKRES